MRALGSSRWLRGAWPDPGQFNDQGQIEGTVVYWFRDSDAGLCSAGKAEVKFTAKLRKGGKGD